jgi:hypothetical protein
MSQTVAMLGLPRTGKSTYIGALWLLVQSPGESDLTEANVFGDRAHIDDLAHHVAMGKEIERTPVDTDEGFQVEIAIAGRGEVLLDIPDLSGEAAREVVEERKWRETLVNTLGRARGVLLFVHPDRIEPPTPANFGQVVAASNSDQSPDHSDFEAESACTAAKLVELLENVIEMRSDAWPLPVAVIVSAWDRVHGTPTPPEWLEDRLPGVQGLLETNPAVVDSAVFGVSALGGHIPDGVQKLMAKGEASERLFARAPDGTEAKLYDPLSWILWRSQ